MKEVLGIEWDGNGHSTLRKGFQGGRVVALIHKLQNHTHSNRNIWQVEIDGQRCEPPFRYVGDAQEFAARQLTSDA